MSTYPSRHDLEKLRKGPSTMLPVVLECAADILTPVSAYLRLGTQETSQAFLLESAAGGETLGRYSYIGIEPFAALESQHQTLTFTHFDRNSTETKPTSFKEIGRYLQRYKTPPIPSLPPLTCGAMGYMAYDGVRYLENIPIPPSSYAPYDLRMMFFRTVLAFDRLKHRLMIIHAIDGSEEYFHQRYDQAVEKLQGLKKLLSTPSPRDALLDIGLHGLPAIGQVEATPLLGRERFCDHVRTMKKHIKRGDIFQGVLSDRFEFPVKTDTFLIYRVLRMLNPAPYLYYLKFGDEELLGASPEMLIKSEGSRIHTHPIAGTRPRGHNPSKDAALERDLLASTKEKAEHLMLLDLGRNDIGRVAKPGSVFVDSFMQVERYSHVMHLVSHVSGELHKKHTPWDALGAAFPAGTLTGAPKIRAMEIISDLERSQRGPYGGAIICADFSGNLNTCITIRSLYVRKNIGYAQAGAGIVADSKPEAEYEEVLHKAKVIRTAVALAHSLAGVTP